MSNAIDESLTAVLNDLPGRVSNQLLLGAIIETRTKLRADISEMSQQVQDLDGRLTDLEAARLDQELNPSLIWLVRYRPGLMLKVLGIMLLLVSLDNLPQWLSMAIELFGG
jgi:hypothetical protein